MVKVPFASSIDTGELANRAGAFWSHVRSGDRRQAGVHPASRWSERASIGRKRKYYVQVGGLEAKYELPGLPPGNRIVGSDDPQPTRPKPLSESNSGKLYERDRSRATKPDDANRSARW
jgi:hypothetical protein